VLAAAGTDSDVGCVVDAHGEWGQVRARYPRLTPETFPEVGLNIAEMVELFGCDSQPVMALVSPPRAPVRCYVSPNPERGSITPESASSPDDTTSPDICMDRPEEEEERVVGLFSTTEDATLLRYTEAEDEEEVDEVLLVTGQMESVAMDSESSDSEERCHDAHDVEMVEVNPTAADAVHCRTPIHKGGSRPSLLGDLIEQDENVNKENEHRIAPLAAPSGLTPKKIVHMGDGYQAVSGQSDTPVPKVQARSRTFYSRAAKSKSPFGSAETGKTPKSRMAMAATNPEGGADAMPKRRLF